MRKKSWGSLKIYQLIITANHAQFHSNTAELTVLINWKILNGCHDFSAFVAFIFYFIF